MVKKPETGNKFTYILLVLLSIFLVACSKEKGKNDSRLPSQDKPPRESSLKIDKSFLLPEKNFEVRDEDITHLVLHFTSNVVNNKKDPIDLKKSTQPLWNMACQPII